MATVLPFAICGPISTAFRSLSPSKLLTKCSIKYGLLSRHSCHLAKQSRLCRSFPRLNEHWLSVSSSYSTHRQRSSCGLKHKTTLPLPGFSVSSHLGIRTTRGESTRCDIFRPISISVPHLAKKGELVTINFINRDGEKITVKARTGQNLLDIVVDNDLDIDGYGACEGTLSCSTCHLIFEEDLFKVLPKPSDEELDMLDLAYGQTDMSRLGCQVILTKEMDGMTVVVPEGVADARDV